ncbi:HAD hydrolase family protein [Clostridium sp. E02]|uniref:HAD hydrolase family protein n=1 Tax=Clostridium sp. E02 TaxID=2487134 RepID=UPI000F52E1D8|nr:HAD hydrolase family protein [Clostridium sp. E02]
MHSYAQTTIRYPQQVLDSTTGMGTDLEANTLLYPGFLKNCNYNCTYCPIPSTEPSTQEASNDKDQFDRFLETFKDQAGSQTTKAVLISPAGEALIYPYYWKGMAMLTCLDGIDAVGAQTNLSFSITKSLKIFQAAGGRMEKLKICAVYHPEMESISRFVRKCNKLFKEEISFSVGVIGIPEHMEIIKELRNKLPNKIYIWVDPVENAKSDYTEDECKAFQKMDSYFLKSPYVDGVNVFGPYPQFRIPWKPKALFFNINGTLISEKSITPDPDIVSFLKTQKENGPLFFATSQTYQEASRRCRDIFPLFRGGIFSGGAHVVLNAKASQVEKELYLPLDPLILPILEKKQGEFGCRLRIFQEKDLVYMLTLEKPASRTWRDLERTQIEETLKLKSKKFRCFIKKNCLYIVASKANKKNGVMTLCNWLSIQPTDCCAAGHDMEDIPMTSICGYTLASKDVKKVLPWD